MKKLIKSLQWVDSHILQILVMGFILLIPLYPKLPLQMINYTYVAIRVEDIYMILIGLVYMIQLARRKVVIPLKWAIFFGLFWIAVAASFLWGNLVLHTIPYRQLGILHSLRRVEYMMIFFVVYTTIKSKKDFYRYMQVFFGVLAVVCIYGIGQKFLGWPAVQTMNPEYAKGYLLTLDAYARISSTFAGHYDLAAYLTFTMPIIMGYYLWSGHKKYFALFLLALATLILTASRASYISYIGAMGFFLLYVRKYKVLLIVILATAILTPLSDNLTSRLTRTFQQTKTFQDPDTGKSTIPREIRVDEVPVGDFGTNFPGTVIDKNKVDAKTQKLAKEEIRKSIVNEAKKSGTVLTEAQIAALVDSTFAKQIPVTKYLVDISISTRFMVEWPRAIAAWLTSPFLGTGPSSMGEATDGDYFRWLSETGVIGTFLFVGIIFEIMRTVWIRLKKITKKQSYLFYGFLFGILSLFVNASYIDVFEASKVAYTFWLVCGIFMAGITYFVSRKIKTEDLQMEV